METVGDRVRRIREAKGIARKHLAQAAGMSYTGLSDLESGKAKSSTKLHRLAARLGVDANYLETGKHAPECQETEAIYSIAQSGLNPAIVFDVARALHEAHEELGLTYNFTADPQLFIDAYQRAATFGNFAERRGSAWLGSHITRAVPPGASTGERPKGKDAQDVHKGPAGRRTRKA